MSTDKSSTKAQDLSAIARRIASHFPKRFYRHYAKWKLRSDPLYAAVFTTLQDQTPLPTLDIGCGIGLLAFYLRERGLSSPMHGMDFDIQKINVAKLVASAYAPSPEFHHADASQFWPDCQGNVCVLDVLQYLDVQDQHALLGKAATHVATDGVLIIRSCIYEDNWRYHFTTLTDRLVNLARLMKSPPLAYPTRESLEQILTAQGLQLRNFEPLYGRTPFNNYLLVFERRASGKMQR